MQLGKKVIQRILAQGGYQLIRTKQTSLPKRPAAVSPDVQRDFVFKNFENLAAAYEYALNQIEGCELLTPNAMRPRLLTRLLGTPPSEAYYILTALGKTKLVEGDVCEFGVAQGETSALIANELASTSKHLHLFDSFEGLPAPTPQDQLKDDIFSLGSIEAYTGTMMTPMDAVLERLAAISFPATRFTIHRGFIEQTLRQSQNLPTQVACAYVDFDFYEPIKTALNFLDTVMPRGAIVIVDDYDFFSTGAKTAVDEFLAQANAVTPRYEMHVPDTRLGYFCVLTKL